VNIFKEKSGAWAFFGSIAVWGIAIGCFMATLNNYLVEIHSITQVERGWLEFFREFPGLMLVFTLALLHKVSDWKVMRIGTIVSMVGVAGLLVPADKIIVTMLIMIWSTGEHLVMPVRRSIAMQLAKEGKAGQSLGYLSSVMNIGAVSGSLLVAAIFWCGTNYFNVSKRIVLYDTVWVIIFVLMLIGCICSFSRHAPNNPSKRPRLYFHYKFSIYYLLELFYGARKQIFLTFAPFVLIVNYGLDTSKIAFLMGICAVVNIFCGPLIGRITDKIGYRNMMIYDTVALFFVCIFYGYSGKWFPAHIALWVVCLNYVMDAVLSTTSLASSLYVRSIESHNDSVTSTLTTGMSINHLISISVAPLGGWIWQQYGVGTLFTLAAFMAIANSLCAMMIPRKREPYPQI
jgi:predicted MFS family arabinose efflux permease